MYLGWYCLFFLAAPLAWGLLGAVVGWVVGLLTRVRRRVATSGACGGAAGGFVAYVGYAFYVNSLPAHIVRQEFGPARVLTTRRHPIYLWCAWWPGRSPVACSWQAAPWCGGAVKKDGLLVRQQHHCWHLGGHASCRDSVVQ
jgi:hypothetical protein